VAVGELVGDVIGVAVGWVVEVGDVSGVALVAGVGEGEVVGVGEGLVLFENVPVYAK
jgi:hypothetical protein